MDLSILIIFNNYFHDLATGVLIGSAAVLYILGRRAEQWGGDERRALARTYPTLTRIAWVALAWIIVGGIPRTIFFTRYEWDPAVVSGIVPALVIKHVLMFAAVIAGGLMWRRMARVARVEATGDDSDR